MYHKAKLILEFYLLLYTTTEKPNRLTFFEKILIFLRDFYKFADGGKYRLSLRFLQYFPNKCLDIPLDKQMFVVYTDNTNICSFCRNKRELPKGKK